MNFFKRLSTIGNRTMARSLAKEITTLYINIKVNNPRDTKKDLIKKTLSQLNLKAATNLLSSGFFDDEKSLSLGSTIYTIVVDSSPLNKNKLFIPQSNMFAYIEEIERVLNEYGLSGE